MQPKQPTELTSALTQLLRNCTRAHQLGEGGLANQDYGLESWVRGFVGIGAEVLNG